MANETPQPEKPKFSLFKISEWPEFIRNWWIRLPGVERLGFRRRRVGKPGERYPPLLYEIRDRWIKINRDMYSVLETIEGIWGTQGQLMGFPPKGAKGDILYNKAGIVQTYVDFGVYSDIDRIPSEATWFNVGTDLVEEDIPYEIPPKEEWGKYAWGEVAVESLMINSAQPWKLTKLRSLKLGSGTVYHEGKMELKEVLHCFGFNKANQLGAMILQYGNLINREFMQRRGVPVELRTNFEQTVATLQSLLGKISEIEQKNFSMLSKLQAETERYTRLWKELVDENTPEAKNIIIRFPHTFRVLKPYLLEEMTETIKKVDENGEIIEETIKIYHSTYLDPAKNPYKRELEEVNKKIKDLGGEVIVSTLENELKKYNVQISKIEPDIKKKRSDVVNKFKQLLLKYLSDILARKKLKMPDKQDILKRVEKSLDDLANSATEEFDEKKTELFLLLESLLKTIGIKEDNIKKIIDAPKKIFDDAIDKEGIRKLNEQLSQVWVNLVNIKSKRKEILELLFRKEQLEFYVKRLTPDNPEFKKRPEEVDYGLDENGYPLEIDPKNDPDTGKVGAVLIDRWWSEIAQNPWQLETIALKPGGKEVLEKHLEAIVTYYEEEDEVTKEKKLRARVTGAKRPRRYVKDERFWGFLDLLEAGHIIFSYWDTVRDDFRDGRYHKHSKSVADYVIEGMGGFDEESAAPYFKGWGPSRKLGAFFTRRGTIPRGPMPIQLNVADRKVQMDADPYWFTNEKPPTGIPKKPGEISDVPSEEEKVKCGYIMKLTKVPEGDLPKYVIKKEDGYYIKGNRVPTKYNPAFDRRAEKIKYIHWGNMYYYRWSYNLNEWSENPFPHMSTRGIALYMAYLAGNDVYYYGEGIEVLKGQKMDYGVRGMLEHGVVNPLEGIGILQEN